MKKFIAISLAVLMICSLGASAFAAYSPQPVPPPPLPKPLPKVLAESIGEEQYKFIVKDRATDEVVGSVDGKLVALSDADDELTEENADSFKAAYEDVKAIEEGLVMYFFWLELAEDIAPENYVSFPFECDGEVTSVTCNGEEVEFVGSYEAKLPGGGAIAIVAAE